VWGARMRTALDELADAACDGLDGRLDGLREAPL